MALCGSAAQAAMSCPAPPQQLAAKVVKEVSRSKQTILGRETAIQRIEQSQRNLYAEYPDASQMIIKLTLVNVFCEMMRTSQLPDAQKTALFMNYQAGILSTNGKTPVKAAAHKPAAKPKAKTSAASKTTPPPSDDPPWVAYTMSQAESEQAVTPAEAKEKAWCVPAFPDRINVVLTARDQFLYLGAAKAAIAKTGQVRIAGYAFEIGMSTKYAIRVGERRARAVADLLVEMGVDGGAVEITSFGDRGAIEPIGSRYCGAIIS